MNKVNIWTNVETFTKAMEAKKYAVSTLSRKIAQQSHQIQSNLKGNTFKEKAMWLNNQFNSTNTKEVKEDGYIWDSRLILPLGFTILRSEYSLKKYEEWILDSIDSRDILTLKKKNSTNTYREYCSNFNQHVKQFTYKIPENPNYSDKIKQIIKDIDNVVLYKDMKMISSGEVNNWSNTYSLTLKNNAGIITLNSTPTGNCQLSTIAYCNTLLLRSSNFRLQLKEIYKRLNKRILLCDINKYYIDLLKEKLPEESIISIQNYISTNSSAMATVLINLSKL